MSSKRIIIPELVDINTSKHKNTKKELSLCSVGV